LRASDGILFFAFSQQADGEACNVRRRCSRDDGDGHVRMLAVVLVMGVAQQHRGKPQLCTSLSSVAVDDELDQTL